MRQGLSDLGLSRTFLIIARSAVRLTFTRVETLRPSLKSKTTTADRHRQTRNAHASETAEDYVEAVFELIESSGKCRVIDLSHHFGVRHVTVNKIIKRLKKNGLVDTKPYGPISLTADGRRMAIKSQRRHETVYQFLLAIGVDVKTATIDAEGIEHHVSPQTLKAFEKFVAKKQ